MRGPCIPPQRRRSPNGQRRRRHQLPQWLPSAHAPNRQLSAPTSGRYFVVLQNRRAFRVRVQSEDLGVGVLVAFDREIENEEVGVAVEGVLETGDHVAIVT